MKLATLKGNTRDGKLVVVNQSLTRAVLVTDIAETFQYAIDHWKTCKPKLETVYRKLNAGELESILPFKEQTLASPLPRAYQWADASAYVNHVELVRKSRGVEMPESFWTDPLIYQGGSDTFLGPQDSIPLGNESWGLDFEAEIAVITDDVPMAVSKSQASNHICLIMLVNDVSLRQLAPAELAKSFGFFQCKPSSAFSPVAVTPDELGDAWDGQKLHLPLRTYLNGKLFGSPDAGTDMTFDFPTLIAHAAKTRKLGAGTIIGSGTVSNYDRSKGSSCIVERRMLEAIEYGKASTPFLKAGDTVKIEMLDKNQHNIFGSIEQSVVSVEEKVIIPTTPA